MPASGGSRQLRIADAIAHATYGVDQFLGKRIIDLASQVAHIDINDARDALEALVPYVIDNHRARHDAPWSAHQAHQQGVFLGSQFNTLPGASHLLRHQLHLQIGDDQRVSTLDGSAAQQGPNAHQQLGQVKGLGQVVIGPGLEVTDLIHYRIASSENKYGQVRPQPTHLGEQRRAAESRQHQIKNQQVIGVAEEVLLAGNPIVGDVDRVALRPQPAGYKVGYLAIIFDEEHPHVSHAVHAHYTCPT